MGTLIIPRADYGQVSGATGRGLTPNWVVKKNTPNEVVYLDTLSPLGLPNTVRQAAKDVNNIFNGRGIPVASRSPYTTGRSMLTQCNEFWGWLDDDGTYYPYPLSCHIVVTAANIRGVEIPDNDVYEFIQRTLMAPSRATTGETPETTVTAREGWGRMRKGILNY